MGRSPRAVRAYARPSTSRKLVNGLRPSVFTAEQFEEIHMLMEESSQDEDACMYDSEPAAEPPSADSQAAETSLLLPSVPRRSEKLASRSPQSLWPQLDLGLVGEPDDEPDADMQSEGASSPSASSSGESECGHHACAGGAFASEPASSPGSEVGLSRIMRHVRRSAEEYEVPQNWGES